MSALRAAEAVLLDANFHVPYRFGDLMESGKVNRGRDTSGRMNAEAFVSYDTAYAVRLHENPQFNFRPPGEGKWLENAMKRRQGKVLTDMAPPLVRVFALP